MKQTMKGPILLLITAVFWGTTFVAQALGSDHVGAHTYNALRFLTAALILGIITIIRKKNQKDNLQLVRSISLASGLIPAEYPCVSAFMEEDAYALRLVTLTVSFSFMARSVLKSIP